VKRSRAPFTECRLYVDGIPELEVGDYLVTIGKRGYGSAYLVTEIKAHRSRPRRRNLRCMRWPLNEIPAGADFYELRWYPRKSTR
jgi:hypothetical protein